ncbi:endonuclease domain-containing protein [Streptomyces sp. NPDC005780]|uniref:endonuclease domain-containing protein n=1 Tax=Streptomyces sp. NPDC005780 TaxID=3364730 RepID=UPI0036B0DB4A
MTANPLCWYWPSELASPERARRTFLEHAERQGSTLEQAEVLWKLESAAESLTGDAAVVLADWQEGRCAICGKARELVCDHDHATGLIRGWLCSSCNTAEGANLEPDTIFARYRERPPTVILGFSIPYVDPITGERAQPRAASAVDWADKWTDAASEDIGL